MGTSQSQTNLERIRDACVKQQLEKMMDSNPRFEGYYEDKIKACTEDYEKALIILKQTKPPKPT